MRIRFAWIAAVLALVSLGLIVACSTKYSSSSNGLVIVPSQGSLVMQSFSLDLSNGSISTINDVDGPPTPGLPTAVIVDPAGTFVYQIVLVNPALPAGAGNITGIATFQIASDGKLSPLTTYPLGNATVTIQVNGQNSSESVAVMPVALAMDASGKFLFVADSASSDSAGNVVPGAVSILAVGSNAQLTEVPASATLPGSPFVLPVGSNANPPNPCISSLQCPSALALSVSSSVFPAQYAACSVVTAPTTENLYVADANNNELWNYVVTSTGNLSLVTTGTNPIPTGTLPSGVAVDPCNRFVFVANTNSNNVSAYTVCTVITAACTAADYSLTPVAGSPFTVGDHPGPIATDAYGGFLYVVDTGSSQVSEFRVGSATGTLTSLGGPIATGLGPNSIAVRKDDSYLFVANITAATVSDFAITPATGNLTLVTAFETFNLPSGVAVK